MTKEQERAELHKTIWRIANDLRGSVDGWDFKSYVLGMLFYRFISENITQRANALVKAAEGGTFDYTRMADDEADVARSQKVSEIGYFILPSELFTNVQQRAAQDENLNITLGISSPISRTQPMAVTLSRISKDSSLMSTPTARSSATPWRSAMR